LWTDPFNGTVLARDGGDADCYRVIFSHVATFIISLPDLNISQTSAHPSIPSESLDHLLHDQIMPRVIAHQGDLVLHGGGVVIRDRAIAISADTGRGKSTLTASFHAAGNQILGDDALVVSNDESRPHVRAVYPSLRLFPDSVAHLFGDAAETRTMAHYSAKRHVTVEGSEATVPLGILIFLAPPAPDISLRRLSVAEACMSLIANSFALDPTDKVWATANMRRASALAAAVPAYALAYPRDYAALPAVHDAILYKLAEVQTP
jgi:hypothetical protein